MSSLVLSLLNHDVTVESNGLKISGRLIALEESRKRPYHRPFTLILKTPSGLCIVRGWTVISFDGRT